MKITMSHDDELFDAVNGMIEDGESDEAILEAHRDEVGDEYLRELIETIRNE